MIKMATSIKAVYRFNTVPVKISMAFFIDIEKKNPKIHMKVQKILTMWSDLQLQE